MGSRDAVLRLLFGVVAGGATLRMAAMHSAPGPFQAQLLGLIQYYGVFVFVFVVATVAALITSSIRAPTTFEATGEPASKLKDGPPRTPAQVEEHVESPSGEESALTPAVGESSAGSELDLGSVWTDFLVSGIGQMPTAERKPTKLEEMKARRRKKAKADLTICDVPEQPDVKDLRSIDELLEGLGDVKVPRPEASIGSKSPAKKKRSARNRAGSACSG